MGKTEVGDHQDQPLMSAHSRLICLVPCGFGSSFCEAAQDIEPILRCVR